MPFTRLPNVLWLAVVTGALLGCEAAGTVAGGGARRVYLVARQALENGNYPLAIRRYETLMSGMGPGALIWRVFCKATPRWIRRAACVRDLS